MDVAKAKKVDNKIQIEIPGIYNISDGDEFIIIQSTDGKIKLISRKE